MNKRIWKLSASFIAAFKACAYRCYAQYVLGIRVIEEAETLRVGTNWHKVLEVLGGMKCESCPMCSANGPDEGCFICGGTMTPFEDTREGLRLMLNAAYADKPCSKSTEDWAVEKMKLWIAGVGYNWYYENDDFEVIAEEIPFEIPLFNEDGNPIEGVILVGKIDKITRSPQGTIFIDEHKSTSKQIDSDSKYWSHLNLDTQTTLYVYAARTLQLWGELEKYGIKADDPLIAGARYDVWKKPQIKAKDLTIAESKIFLESATYAEESFHVLGTFGKSKTVTVNDEEVTYRMDAGPKKDKLVVRETPHMYGARLMHSIIDDPQKHYARKCIARTDADLERFEKELTNIYQTVKFLDDEDRWWRNEQQCEATFTCPYVGQCYNNVVLDPKNPPEGFKCIFKDHDEKVNATE